jgi:peptidylprolyl isomerase
VLLCALIGAALVGCGGSARSLSSQTSTHAVTPATTEAAPPPAPRPAEPLPNRLPRPHGPGAHPHAQVTRLIVRDLVKGSGMPIYEGDNVVLDYIAANYTKGKVYDFTWGTPHPGSTIDTTYLWMPGLVKGLEGMRVGGQRIIIVPRRLSDVDSDRAGNSYREIVYWHVFLRGAIPSAKHAQYAARYAAQHAAR